MLLKKQKNDYFLNIHIQNTFLRKLNPIIPLNYSKSVYYILGTVGSLYRVKQE